MGGDSWVLRNDDVGRDTRLDSTFYNVPQIHVCVFTPFDSQCTSSHCVYMYSTLTAGLEAVFVSSPNTLRRIPCFFLQLSTYSPKPII